MTWLVILGVGIGSFALRAAPLLVLGRAQLGEGADRMIRHAGSAAIAALVALSAQDSASGSATLPTVLALAVALVLAVRGASMVRLLVAGGAVYAGALLVADLLTRLTG